jgi:hypothetical protein
MDPEREKTDNNGEGEVGTSNTENLINGLDRKRRQVTECSRQILGEVARILPRLGQPAAHPFSDEAATIGARRNGEENKTPTKVGASGYFSLLEVLLLARRMREEN